MVSNRPPPRTSASHSHTQTQRTSSKTSTTPLSPHRLAASVGQALPPHIAHPQLRSPGVQTDVRTPSPNYFALSVDPASNPRDSGVGPRDNWSPPSSSIRSFGATSPQHIPLDAHPNFEAFRKQADLQSGFQLGHGNLSYFASTPSAAARPSRGSESKVTKTQAQEQHSPKSGPRVRNDVPEPISLNSRGRASEKALNAPSFFGGARQQSPGNITDAKSPLQSSVLSSIDDRHPRLSLPQNRVAPPSPGLGMQTRNHHTRAETLPSSLEDGPTMISAEGLKDIITNLPSTEFLLLDLRPSSQFAPSRIKGALNLCIPTTLLKRPSYDLQRLQDTLNDEAAKARFRQWKQAKYLVMYDAQSNEKGKAESALNTFKKFADEGWKGYSYILRGGINTFQKDVPELIDLEATNPHVQTSRVNLSLGTGVVPVAGGCLMPATKNAANPFFSNIRQNQDLLGGVGQMDIKIPKELESGHGGKFSTWLIEAADPRNHGKIVSDKWLSIELAEKDRMTKALNNGVSYGTPNPNNRDVQIAGVEKGAKNRYNNIWPFEHTRVKIQGRSENECDYINASHVQTTRSNKRYIASQGPVPATFEDFWSVIWDQDVRVIVMLTATEEGGTLKCHSYWKDNDYGPYQLRLLSEKKTSLLESRKHRRPAERFDSGRRRANTTSDNLPTAPQPEEPHVMVRKFALRHDRHPFVPVREITQIHYSSWPDFGAPASPAQLLGLVELTNSYQRRALDATQPSRPDEPVSEDETRPMLVHCSAGCGRTGTFCTIDSVIDMIKRQKKERESGITPMEYASTDYMSQGQKTISPADWIHDDNVDLIETTVKDFRGQRISMVQTLKQFVLCYETVLEWTAKTEYRPNESAPTSGRERSGSDSGFSR